MEIGKVELVDIEREMRSAYLDYAMSVITARALPDVRDGLKPAQRRVLYTMYDNGLRPDRPYKKSAATVGDVLGRFHPHGDSAVYDTMVRLAQDFSLRYPLIDGQGNFGSVDGDPAAAYRYTEARPSPLAMEMLADIDRETVDFRPNFDDSTTEPSVLPSRAPNLLINGATGIAVGMATNIPPHNLGEVCDALTYLIDRYYEVDQITVQELMRLLPGPDFPTGASVVGIEGIVNAYATGRGRVVMRAETHFEELPSGRQAIVVDAIPYQVNKATLVERIADLARSRKIESISDLRDETDRHGTRIVIELKRGASPHTTLNKLMKFTQMQQTFGVNVLALVGGEPRILPLKRMLTLFVEHRLEVIRRRSEYDLRRARHRQHVLEGLRIALEHIDEIIRVIRESDDGATARDNLITRFGLSEIQAQAILDMQLRRLAALERQKIEEEYQEVTRQIEYLEGLLSDERQILGVVRADLADLKATYADARRTTLLVDESGELSVEDLVTPEDVLITVTGRGYIKRGAADTYRAQQRGGRGSRGARPRADDEVCDNLLANTHDMLLFFTDRGRVFQLPAYRVPDAGRDAAGTPMPNLIQIAGDERVTVTLAVPLWQFQHGTYLVMATRKGRIKRTVLRHYEDVRPSGLIAMNLSEGDALGWVRITTGDNEVLVVTRRGRALRFHERQVRPMGRAAGGVNAIRLRTGDEVAAVDLVRPDADLLVVTRQGYGKRTPLEEYPRRSRAGQGVLTIDARRLAEIGEIADARVVAPGDEIALISDHGIVIRTDVQAISRLGRPTRGVRVMRLDEGHQIVSLAYICERVVPEGYEPPAPGSGARTGHGERRAQSDRDYWGDGWDDDEPAAEDLDADGWVEGDDADPGEALDDPADGGLDDDDDDDLDGSDADLDDSEADADGPEADPGDGPGRGPTG